MQPHYSVGSAKYSPGMKCSSDSQSWFWLKAEMQWRIYFYVIFHSCFVAAEPRLFWTLCTTSKCVRVRASAMKRACVPLTRLPLCTPTPSPLPKAVTHESGGSSNSGRSCPRCWNQTCEAPHSDAQLSEELLRKLNTEVRAHCFFSSET